MVAVNPPLAPRMPTMAPKIAAPVTYVPVKLQPEKISFSADALFDFDKAVLRERGKNLLSDLSDKLQGADYEAITVTGHTDWLGTPNYNKKLSEKRAAAVKTYLVEQGVPSDKIQMEGMGETQPEVPMAQCNGLRGDQLIACLQPDRRVEIEVAATKQRI